MNRYRSTNILPGLYLSIASASLLVALSVVGQSPTTRQFKVTGPSMAPTLWGDHWLFSCDDCGYGFRVCNEYLAADRSAVCPNCGAVASSAEAIPGELVATHPSSRPPQRGEVWVMHDPIVAGQFDVKRVVGLPGENVVIDNGDIYINGRRLQKSLAEFRQVALPVYVDRFQATTLRIRPENADSGWAVMAGEYHFQPTKADSSRDETSPVELDRLIYQHQRCFHSPYPLRQPDAVFDHFAGNQRLSREMNYARDFSVRCEITLEGDASIRVELTNGANRFSIEFSEPRQEWVLRDELHVLHRGPLGLRAMKPFTCELAMLDGRVLAAVDEKPLCAVEFDEQKLLTPTTTPISFIAQGGAVVLTNVQLMRDRHYIGLAGEVLWSSGELAADEYCVLGDNPPASLDSRQWGKHAVRQKLFFGRLNH